MLVTLKTCRQLFELVVLTVRKEETFIQMATQCSALVGLSDWWM